jgi:hypothetical protein
MVPNKKKWKRKRMAAGWRYGAAPKTQNPKTQLKSRWCKKEIYSFSKVSSRNSKEECSIILYDSPRQTRSEGVFDDGVHSYREEKPKKDQVLRIE